VLTMKRCFALLVFCTSVLAQNAVVSGRVTDPSEAVIPSAAIEFTNRSTDVKTVAQANAEGRYISPPLAPGIYDVSCSASGFATARLESIVLEVGQRRTLDFDLKAGSVTESISVNDQAPLLEAEKADRGSVVENQFVLSIPLNTRNPLLLMRLVAGVIPGAINPGDNTASESTTANFHINGSRSNTNEILLDGAANTGTYNNQVSAIPQVDAIQEFKVNTNPYDAEFGRTGGGVVSYSIKSGTNSIHGNLHEFLQNYILDANGFNANKANQPRASFRKNQYGFVVGGPAVLPKIYNGRNRTFFFVAYEGLRQSSYASFLGTVPTAAERQGDFSHTYDTNGKLITIYDPATTRLNPNAPAGVTQYIRDAFAGNVIPQNRLNTIASNLLKYYPSPNQPGIGLSDTNNFLSSASNTLANDRIDARVDHQFNEKHSIFGRGDWFNDLNAQPLVYGNVQSPVQTPNVIPGTNWMVNHTWVISPNIVFQHHFSLANSQTNRVPLTLGFDQSTLGFPSTVTTGQTAPYFPVLSATGLSGLGPQGTADNVVISRTYQYAASMTMLRGSHAFKAGFDWRLFTVSINNPLPLSISASSIYTAGPNPQAAATSTGAGLASLLLGAASVSYNINPPVNQTHPYYGAFFQDEWHVTPRLTLTLGVRYNLELPIRESNNRDVFLDLTSPSPLKVPGYNLTGGIGFVGVNGLGTRTQVADTNNWDPRAGIVYRVNEKTVIRTGGGIFHSPLVPNTDVSQGFTRTTSNLVTQADTVTPTFSLSNPFPQGLIQPTGNASGLGTLLGQSISGPLRDQRLPYVAQWSFDVQRQLPFSILVEAGYTGNSSVALPTPVALNQLTPANLALGSQLLKTVANPFYGYITDSTSILSLPTVQYAQLLRPYPQFTGLSASQAPFGHANYHALELKVERRFAQGLAVLFNYTRSKAIDNVGELGSFLGQSAGFNNTYCFSCDRALSYLDVPNYMNLSVSYELPFGVGKKWLHSGWVGRAAGNWSVAGIYSYATGLPVVVTSPNNTSAFNTGVQRPNATGQSAALPGGPSISDGGQYFNAAAFVQTPQFQFGNVSRELPDVRNPASKNLDLLIQKQIAFTERFRLEFRTEMFNATNSVVFAGPQTSISSTGFGTIALSQVNTPRVVQFALRMSF
jgi:hypothetical protein